MRALFIILFLFSCKALTAQDIINSDRPDQTDDTELVNKHHLQIETGAEFSRQEEIVHGFSNVTLIRYGISKKFEIRLLNEYEEIADSNKITGFQPLSISSKNILFEQQGWRPAVTLISYLQLPITFSKNFPGRHIGYSVIIASMHSLGSKATFYSNVGLERDQQGTCMDYPATAELNIDITKKLSAFVEYFGKYAAHTKAENGVDIGIVYAVKSNLSIDIAAGSPTGKLTANRFISFGIATRFPN